MSDSILSGSEANESIIASAPLYQKILLSEIGYGYVGFETPQPDVSDAYISHLARIVINESVRTRMAIWAVSFDNVLRHDKPVTIRKGYWGFQRNNYSALFPNMKNLVYDFSGEVRLAFVARIETKKQTSLFIEHSLCSNSLLLLSEMRDVTGISILKLIGNISSTPWHRDSYFVDVLNIVNKSDDVVIFSSGGFDYGGIYLNSLEKLCDRKLETNCLTRRFSGRKKPRR